MRPFLFLALFAALVSGSYGQLTVAPGKTVRLMDADGSHWVELKAPDTITANVTLTLPNTDGFDAQALLTNGAGILDWGAGGGGGGGSSTLPNGRVGYGSASNLLTSESAFTYDAATDTMGVGRMFLGTTPGKIALSAAFADTLKVEGITAGQANENLYIDFATANEVGIFSTSGVTLLDFGTIGLTADSLTLTDGLTLDNIQDVSQNAFLVRMSSGTGPLEVATIGPQFSLAGSTLSLSANYIEFDSNIDDLTDGILEYNLEFNGGYTVKGPSISPLPALVGTNMDLDEFGETYTATSDATLAFLGTPTEGQIYILNIIASGGARTTTFPSSRSIDLGTDVTTVTTQSGGSTYLTFRREAARWVVFGYPVTTTGSGAFVLQDSPVINTPSVTGAIGFPDGVVQTFNPNGTNPGLVVGSVAGDPSAPVNGALWYDSTANELTARINGANVALGAGGGGGGLASTDIDTSAELAAILGDETGSSGGFVRAGSPTFTGTVTMDVLNVTTFAASTLEFEGSTADGFETFITVEDPTADRTWRIPNATSTDFVGVNTVQTLENKSLTTAANTLPAEIGLAVSDETTAITTGTGKLTFRMPYGMTLTEVRASVGTAPTGATILVDINEGGATVLSTKLMIDATEKTSTTATTAYVISDATLADDAEITIDIDQIGSTIAGAGLKIWLIGTK